MHTDACGTQFCGLAFFGFSWNLFAVGRVSLFLLKVILFKFSEAAFNRLNFHSLLFKYKEYQYEWMNECDHLIKQRRGKASKIRAWIFQVFLATLEMQWSHSFVPTPQFRYKSLCYHQISIRYDWKRYCCKRTRLLFVMIILQYFSSGVGKKNCAGFIFADREINRKTFKN